MTRANLAAGRKDPGSTRLDVWFRAHGAQVVIWGFAAVLLGMTIAMRGKPREALWLLIAGFLLTCVAGIGHAVTGRADGALISERRRMSLSQLQAILWTVVVASTLATVAISNLLNRAAGGGQGILAVTVPGELWVALGISATALAAAPLIRSAKSAPVIDGQRELRTLPESAQKQFKSQGRDAERFTVDGRVAQAESPQDAWWADLFQGEEINNALLVDLGKVQMFFCTVLLLLIYCAALFQMFRSDAAWIGELPPFTEAMVILLAISNGTYVLNKAVPHG